MTSRQPGAVDRLPRWWLLLVSLMVVMQFAWWISAPALRPPKPLQRFRPELAWLDTPSLRNREAARLWSPALYALPAAVGFLPPLDTEDMAGVDDLLRPPIPEGILSRRDDRPVPPLAPGDTEELQRSLLRFFEAPEIFPAGQVNVEAPALRCALRVTPRLWHLDQAALAPWLLDQPGLPPRGSIQFEVSVDSEHLVDELLMVRRTGESEVDQALLQWIRRMIPFNARPGRATVLVEWMRKEGEAPPPVNAEEAR